MVVHGNPTQAHNGPYGSEEAATETREWKNKVVWTMNMGVPNLSRETCTKIRQLCIIFFFQLLNKTKTAGNASLSKMGMLSAQTCQHTVVSSFNFSSFSLFLFFFFFFLWPLHLVKQYIYFKILFKAKVANQSGEDKSHTL